MFLLVYCYFHINKRLDDQPIAFCLLFGEMMQAIIMNSFCIGVVYARISRAFVRSLILYFTNRHVHDLSYIVEKQLYVKLMVSGISCSKFVNVESIN